MLAETVARIENGPGAVEGHLGHVSGGVADDDSVEVRLKRT